VSSGADIPSTPVWNDGPYSVKRYGVSITNCDSEPVQTPGCIQAHGVLFVLRSSDLTILQVSENAERWLGRSPQALLGQPVVGVLGASAERRLRSWLREGSTEHNPRHLLTLEATDAQPELELTAHTSDGATVIELEPPIPTDVSAPDYYALVGHSVGRLQGGQTLQHFCQTVTQEVRRLTGFDRVMVYKFHEDGHGEVFSESRRDDLQSWLGLHYPAEDIPKPAREIFKQLWIRPVPEVGAELAELIPLTNPDTGKPLTMTFCALRGPSVMYTEYLQNMGVKAALTLSIRRGEMLWGLIACHHYSASMQLPHAMRAACELFAQVVSLQHHAAEEQEHHQHRIEADRIHQELLAAVTSAGEFTAVAASMSHLLKVMQVGGAALFHERRWSMFGTTPTESELDGLRRWLRDQPSFMGSNAQLFATDSLSRHYAPAEGFAESASGLLAVPLAINAKSLMLWFRPELVRTLKWGGNPDEKPMVTGPHGPRLTPRKSFELFVQSVRLTSRPWQQFELEAANRLRILLMQLVVSQVERLTELNAELSRSNEELDAFAYVASHDLKEPLRGINKYAHQLLEDATLGDADQRKKLDRLMRLTVRMDSLLDSLLQFSRVGRVALRFEEVDLAEVLAEAVEIVEARQSEWPTDLLVQRRLPIERCDRSAVREVFVNLLSNALKYNDKPRRIIEVGYVVASGSEDSLDARQHNVYFVRDNGFGIHPRHHQHVFKIFRRLHGRDEHGGGNGAGLTIVKKIVERHRGEVWVESSPGQGSTFFFTLRCEEAGNE